MDNQPKVLFFLNKILDLIIKLVNQIFLLITSIVKYITGIFDSSTTTSSSRLMMYIAFFYCLHLIEYSKRTGTLDANTIEVVKWLLGMSIGGKIVATYNEGGNNVTEFIKK